MTPEQRHRTEMLRTAMNAFRQQFKTGMLPVELAVTDSLCDEIAAFTRHDADAEPWHQAATATKRLIHEGDEVWDEWIAVYAELPAMERPIRD
jgi:hypothetical protein